MVFLDEGPAASLLRLLTRPARADKGTPGSEDAGFDSTPDAKHAFDLADCMEKGLARELVADFTQPLQRASRLWKFHVERSQDRRHFRLFCHRGEFLMYAKVSRNTRDIRFFLYEPREAGKGLHDHDRPAFTMTCNAQGTQWQIFQDRCDACHYSPKHLTCSCQGKPAILSIRHSRVSVGDGVNHCMAVEVPPCFHGGEQFLVSKMPVWNEDVGSLVLDFLGRQVLASAKNFQLALEADPSHVVCQHGKIGPDTFSLDFRYPMTVIQAFGISMSTLNWV